MALKVFISWSGSPSQELAEAFSTWIPKVLHGVKPYFTPSDIEKGARWATDIASELEECNFGLLFIAPNNVKSPWVIFEAGALSKHLANARVCPILFGLESSDLTGPLVQFQASYFTQNDMKKLIASLNGALPSDHRVRDTDLPEIFETWWPKLQERVQNIPNPADAEPAEPQRGEREILEEILELARLSASQAKLTRTTDTSDAKIRQLVRYSCRLVGNIDRDCSDDVKQSLLQLITGPILQLVKPSHTTYIRELLTASDLLKSLMLDDSEVIVVQDLDQGVHDDMTF